MGENTLIVANSIKVLTQNGECQIDLCLGDITKLKKEDKVDVICVSAFKDNYVPTKTSVIGALKRNLDISVKDLAKSKEEDLRKLYSCWSSKPLPDRLPYRRLLCFEAGWSGGAGRPQELVANVFRCLVPILNNEDGTVITPLLNTGNQRSGEVSMLKGMVECAVNWMKAGLPLRLMKLVLYGRVVDGDLQSYSLRRFDEVLKKFGELKERYEMQLLLPKAVPLEFDVYLSFSEEDEAVAKVIREKLNGAKDGIRIYDSSKQALDSENVFQQDMYSVMMKSARVVTVLSPNYLKNKACIEQYNIALCCNRRALRDMLAPFYVDSVELMPTYMGLVQYVDCRPHDPSKIQDACSQISVSLTVKLHTELRVAEFDPLHYDVFLSYSHRDTEQANRFVRTLQRLAPDLKLFFDVQELKTGKSWQRTLYHSIDGSRCMLALLSAPYLKSAICQEEFALAKAKHFAKGKQHLQLIPVCLEELESIPAEFSHIPMVKGTPDVLEETVQTICPAVVQWLKGEKMENKTNAVSKLFDETSPAILPDNEMEAFRLAQFQKEFGTSDCLINSKSAFPPPLHNVLADTSPGEHKVDKSFPSPEDASQGASAKETERPQSASDCDVIFSYHSDDQKYVKFMAALLEKKVPGLKVRAVASNEHENLNALERSDCIVPILSPNYLESPECIEEFHIALWRQRTSDPDAPLLFPVRVHSLPQKPTYFHLVHCPVSATDHLWAKLTGQHHLGLPQDIEDIRIGIGSVQVPRTEAVALLIFIYKMLQRFAKARSLESKEHSPRPALFNIMHLRAQTRQITKPYYTNEVTQKILELHITDIPEEWQRDNQCINERPGSCQATNAPLTQRHSNNRTSLPQDDSSGALVVANPQSQGATSLDGTAHSSHSSESHDLSSTDAQPSRATGRSAASSASAGPQTTAEVNERPPSPPRGSREGRGERRGSGHDTGVPAEQNREDEMEGGTTCNERDGGTVCDEKGDSLGSEKDSTSRRSSMCVML